jgi:membrane peptidoglycan carboxypeptidase
VLYAMRRDGVIDAGELDAARAASLHFAPGAVDR